MFRPMVSRATQDAMSCSAIVICGGLCPGENVAIRWGPQDIGGMMGMNIQNQIPSGNLT